MANHADPIARLQERIDTLVVTRQEMRARGASLAELESNRLELSNRQRQLSHAILLAHERLAA